MIEDEKDAGVTEEVMSAELTDEQVWAQVTGQDDADITSQDSEAEVPGATASDEAEENAEQAISEGSDSGEGQEPPKQPEPKQEIRRLRGQIGGKDRRIHDLEQRLAGLSEKAKEMKSQKADASSLDELRELYPDILNPVLDETAAIRKRVEALSESVETVSELHQTRAVVDSEQEVEIFDTKRPDGFKVVEDNRDAFWQWVDDQPKRDRELAYASQKTVADGAGLAELLNRFDVHLGGDAPVEPVSKEAPPQRGVKPASQARLAGARIVSGGAQKATSKPQANETDEVAIWNQITQ